ncbi:MAG: carboxypeptidase regulatory-like domain-containing protein, partial [Blastocatellia bacterium]|nr:carboxypeptidase regulatory-like domain-containing protein [Blastocatellia bacterium]
MSRLNATHISIRSGLLLSSLISGAIYTSAQTGGITGKITDDFGGVIVGAEIKAVISSSDQAAPRQTFRAVSNGKGEFEIPALPVGFYEVEVKSPGFTTLKEKVVVDGRQPIRVDLQLMPPKVCDDSKGSGNIDQWAGARKSDSYPVGRSGGDYR